MISAYARHGGSPPRRGPGMRSSSAAANGRPRYRRRRRRAPAACSARLDRARAGARSPAGRAPPPHLSVRHTAEHRFDYRQSCCIVGEHLHPVVRERVHHFDTLVPPRCVAAGAADLHFRPSAADLKPPAGRIATHRPGTRAAPRPLRTIFQCPALHRPRPTCLAACPCTARPRSLRC